MESVGGRILDIYDDIGLKVLAQSGHLEKVASLQMADPDTLAGLEDSKFGVVFLNKRGETIRKYPVHDYTHTLLANVYYDATHEKLSPEVRVMAATQIKNASALFGVKALPAVEKYAASARLEGKNYVRLGKQAVAIEEPRAIFQDLQDSYEANKDRYSREDRRKLASDMEWAAEKFGFEIPVELQSFTLKDPEIDKEAMQAQCVARKNLVTERPEAARLMNEFMEKSAEFDPKEAVDLLETFDKEFGLEKYWTRGLEPNLILREKVARHAIPFRGSATFTNKELKAFISKNKVLLDTMFGKDLADKIRADHKEIWSLPKASRDFVAARIEHDRENAPKSAK